MIWGAAEQLGRGDHRHQMFKFYQPGDVDATDVDPVSIMMYPIPKSWTTDGFSAGMNGELSDMDKSKVRSHYPR